MGQGLSDGSEIASITLVRENGGFLAAGQFTT
jgi:hypothetical protein